MEKMKKTDEPQLVSGCMRWGKWGKQLSKEQMASLINDLIENGIHFFDHADIYGEYTTEAEFGNAVKYLGMARQNYHICTKLGLQIPSEKRRTNIKHYQYDHDHIINSVNSSISKLDCEHIDALLLHRPSPLMNEMKVMQAINEKKKSG
jgi:predicted oxidoreductase